MMNKKWFAAMLGAAAMAVSAGAVAQQADTGLYVGASIGQADLDIDKDTAWKIFGGYQLNRNLSVELGYTNLGEVSETVLGVTASAEATAWEVIGLYKFPVANQFSIYGLAGIAMVEAEARALGVTVSDDSTELTFGVGAQYDFSTNVGLRAQWQRYGADEDIDVISLGVVVKF
jgi:OOP family OmpA-OmpF porin